MVLSPLPLTFGPVGNVSDTMARTAGSREHRGEHQQMLSCGTPAHFPARDWTMVVLHDRLSTSAM